MQTSKLFLKNERHTIKASMYQDIISFINHSNNKIARYNIRAFNSEFNQYLLIEGWTLNICLSRKSKITINAIKNDVGLCVQTGNVARMYADLLKLQSLYRNKTIRAAIYIVPQKDCAKTIGQNVANFERLQNELTNVFNKVITIPLLVIGFNNEEKNDGNK